MGILSRLFRPAPETRASMSYGPSFSLATGGGPITPWAAENLSTVVACVNAISGTLATLPVCVYRSQDGGRVELPGHPVARLLRAPNTHQTWPDFAEWLISQTLLYGNGLAALEYDGAGRVLAMIPVPWKHVNVQLLPSGRMVYDVVAYQTPWGGTGTPRRLLEGEVFHLKARSDDGYVGRSVISRAPDVLNAAIGLQTYSSAVWANAATPSGMVGVPPGLDAAAFKRMVEHFTDRYTGAANGRKVVFSDAGTTFTPMSVSPEDAEVLASRQFSTVELCRLFNVPPPIIQAYENNTFTNAATASTWFATNTLTPWARKIEAEFARSVFSDPTGATHIEIDLSGLVRGDYATRWAANVAAVTAGILTADEVRSAEGYGPLPVAAVPVAAAPVGTLTPPAATPELAA